MLEQALKDTLEGEVSFNAQTKALYSTDASNYRQIPVGVVIPKTIDDVTRTIKICRARAYLFFVTWRRDESGGAMLQYRGHPGLLKTSEQDPADRSGGKARARAPGVILDHLRHEAEKYGLTFGPDPATHSRCTLGGMIGNNSCGVHALMGGKTVDNVEHLRVLTYDGLTLDVGPTSDAELERIIRDGGRRGDLYARLKPSGQVCGPYPRALSKNPPPGIGLQPG